MIPSSPTRVRVEAIFVSGEDVALSAHDKNTRKERKTGREFKEYALQDRAEAEVDLIVALYFDGLSLSKIAQMLGRPVEYVSRVFHSPKGKMLVNQQKRTRQELASEIQDRVAYAAQGALDKIIELAQCASSEAVALRASETLLDKALPQPARGAAVQVNIGDEAIDLAVRALREVDSYRPPAIEITAEEK